MRKYLVYTAVILIIVALASFYAGTKYQQSKILSRFGNQRGGSQFAQRGGLNQNRANFQPVNGEIISKDEKSITVKLQDGSSKIVLFSDSTLISKSESASKEDLKEGEKVFVVGTANSDGSINAQDIQLNPPNRMLFNR